VSAVAARAALEVFAKEKRMNASAENARAALHDRIMVDSHHLILDASISTEIPVPLRASTKEPKKIKVLGGNDTAWAVRVVRWRRRKKNDSGA
jgi:hypothetical protein